MTVYTKKKYKTTVTWDTPDAVARSECTSCRVSKSPTMGNLTNVEEVRLLHPATVLVMVLSVVSEIRALPSVGKQGQRL